MENRTRLMVAAICALPFGSFAACPSDVDTALMAARYACPAFGGPQPSIDQISQTSRFVLKVLRPSKEETQ